jgi:membrane protease YdiL (CAAX protease family)
VSVPAPPRTWRAWWRSLPLGGFALDLAIYGILLTALSFGAVFWSAVVDSTQRARDEAERMAWGPQAVFLRFTGCSRLDPAALLRELAQQGEVRPHANADGPSDATTSAGTTSPLPGVALWDPIVVPDPADPDAKTHVFLSGFVWVDIDPAPGQLVVIDFEGIGRSAGCLPDTVLTLPLASPAPPTTTTGGVPSRLILASVLATALATLLAWLARASWLRGQWPTRPMRSACLLAVAIAFGLQFLLLIGGIVLAQLDIALRPSNLAPIVQLLKDQPAVAYAFVLVLAPVTEELFFRHLVLRRFALAGHPVLGLLLSSSVFAVLHELTPASGDAIAHLAISLLYLLMGVAYGALYLRTGRLVAVMLAHALSNALALLLMRVSGQF